MTRRNKRQPIKPKKMRHRNKAQKAPENSIVVHGEVEETVTGGVVMGTKCKGYEQLYEYMDPGAATALLVHPKKSRTIMVIAGAGFAAKFPKTEKGEEDKAGPEEPLAPGNVVEFPAGIPYRITATADSQLEFFVVQEKAYLTHLKSTGEATEGQDPVVHDEFPEQFQTQQYLEVLERETPTRRPTGASKAAQQNLRFRGGTHAGTHIASILGSTAAAHQPGGAGIKAAESGTSHSLGVNPQPTNG